MAKMCIIKVVGKDRYQIPASMNDAFDKLVKKGKFEEIKKIYKEWIV